MSSRSTASASKLLVAAAVLAALAGDAWAKKRVAVVPFTGRGGDALHDDVEEIVQEDATVVSQGAFVRSQKKLRAARLSDSNVARIAADLQVDAVIEGALEKRRGGYTLFLTVHDGKTGAVSDTIDLRLRAARLDGDSRADLTGKLLPALAKVGGLSSDEPVDISPNKPDEVDTEQPLVAAPAAAPATTPPPAEVSADGDQTRDVDVSTQRFARNAAVDVEVGLGASLRNLRFTFASTLPASERPNGYKGQPVPTVVLTGEIYPLSFGGGRGLISGLGVAFDFERALLLKSKLGMTEYDTTQQQLGAGLRFRIPFGSKPTLPTLKLIAGWSRLEFNIKRGAADLDLPNVAYSWIDMGAAGRFPLGTPNAAIYAEARYLLVLDAGEITKKEFYGSGGKIGVDGDLGIELLFARRAILRVGARYQRIAFDFDGTGDWSNMRDGNVSTQDVGGALDQFFAAYVTGGYLF